MTSPPVLRVFFKQSYKKVYSSSFQSSKHPAAVFLSPAAGNILPAVESRKQFRTDLLLGQVLISNFHNRYFLTNGVDSIFLLLYTTFKRNVNKFKKLLARNFYAFIEHLFSFCEIVRTVAPLRKAWQEEVQTVFQSNGANRCGNPAARRGRCCP